jgi:hypothetical protein
VPTQGAKVLGFATVGDTVLAVGSVPGPQGRAPGAWSSPSNLNWRNISLDPATGYGQQAELTHLAIAQDAAVVLGTAFGGAHGNARLTTWSASGRGAGVPEALVEHEQPFELLGGPRAMSVVGAAAGSGTSLLVGQWEAPNGRPDAAVWVSTDGIRWTRQDDDPALASAEGEQLRARGVTHATGGFITVGDVSTAATGQVAVAPVVWTSADGHSWRREPMPVLPADSASTSDTTASRVACDAAGCLALGVTTTYAGTYTGSNSGGGQQVDCWLKRTGGEFAPPVRGGPAVAGNQLMDMTGLVLDSQQALVTVRVGGQLQLWSVSRNCADWRQRVLPVASRDAAVTVLHDPASGTPTSTVLLSTIEASGSRLWTSVY